MHIDLSQLAHILHSGYAPPRSASPSSGQAQPAPTSASAGHCYVKPSGVYNSDPLPPLSVKSGSNGVPTATAEASPPPPPAEASPPPPPAEAAATPTLSLTATGGRFSASAFIAESTSLEQFSLHYRDQYQFRDSVFSPVFSALVENRLCERAWLMRAPPENVFRVMQALRVLLRDIHYQKEFFQLGGVKVLAERLVDTTNLYYQQDPDQVPFLRELLVEMSSIFQKLALEVHQREWLVACGAHRTLVLLLSASDLMVLHCSLQALTSLARSEQPRQLIGALNCIEMLIRILQDYGTPSKRLAIELLHVLCVDEISRDQVKTFDGIPICLSLLHSDDVTLLRHVVGVIEKTARDPEASKDVRVMGGIPLLLSLITVYGPCIAKLSIGDTGGDFRRVGEVKRELLLLQACCVALSQLALNDTNAHHIRQSNGIYLLALLTLPPASVAPESLTGDEAAGLRAVQGDAFRTLRFLFSVERNRRLFKRIFPTELFELFIDVGHYATDIALYAPMVAAINQMSKHSQDIVRQGVEDTNINKTPRQFVGNYAVLELLGRGAFGSVYKVKKRNGGQTHYAMKELMTNNAAVFGKTHAERSRNIGDLMNEVSMIETQLRHPNVVRYYHSFVEGDYLYIIMEIIEGASLQDYINSYKEKNHRMPEDRLMKILTQLILALRYIHKEKHIVHRDLTPANIMLDEKGNVKITDFGLAREKQHEASIMQSVVGTILYSCPEMIQHQPYGEKADIWALGCVLYNMAALVPPFYSSNMLALATKIVEADYEPLPDGAYSSMLRKIIDACLTVSTDDRPDVVELAALMAPVLLDEIDKLHINDASLNRELERERRRTHRHFNEAHRNMQNYHRLFLASQERRDNITARQNSRLGLSSLDDDDSPRSAHSSGSLTEIPPSTPQVIVNSIDSDSPISGRQRRRTAEGTPVSELASNCGTPVTRSSVLRRALSVQRTPGRPSTATATLTISPRKVRQINDPILQMLNQLHKLIFLTQLPPALDYSPARSVVDRYKRALFAPQSGTFNLKSEMKKFIIGSKEVIDLNFNVSGLGDIVPLAGNHDGEEGSQDPVADKAQDDLAEGKLTYEQIQNIIERCLVEVGYYDLMAQHRRAPLSPSKHPSQAEAIRARARSRSFSS